jgi:hypothetical protein
MGKRDFMAKHMLMNNHMRSHALPDRKERFEKRHDDDWKDDLILSNEPDCWTCDDDPNRCRCYNE